MSISTKTWLGRAVAALVGAVVVNTGLATLGVEHDAALITLLVVATVTAGALVLEALEALQRPSWAAPRPDSRPSPGEDTRTAMFRHLVEAHQSSREVDDAVLWQLADLAARRLRQVHGLRHADDPVRATALLGPHLSDLVGRSRRERYQPDHRQRRHSVGQLAALVDRIEGL